MGTLLSTIVAAVILVLGIVHARRNLGRAILVGLAAGLVGGIIVSVHHTIEMGEVASIEGTIFGLFVPFGRILGPFVTPVIERCEIFGAVFIAALKLVIVPLIVGTIVSGVASIGDMRKLGRIGAKTLAYYALTTSLAVSAGILVVNVIEPGVGASTESAPQMDEATKAKVEANANTDMGEFLRKQILSVLINPFKAFAEGQVLAIIFFSIFLGAVIANTGEKGRPLGEFFSSLGEVMMVMVDWILVLAPAGAFALLAGKLGESGLPTLIALGKYMLTVLAGLGIHAFITLPILLVVLGRMPIRRFLSGMRAPIILAFSTSSSSATLPVTMEALEDNIGVDPKISSFVLPLGATVNMDGTALYEAVAVMFIAQASGIDLTAAQQLTIFLTATLASIGAAGIPSAGLFMMVVVLEAVGMGAEGIGLILAVDRILDMCRTTINVIGDSVGTVIIDTTERGAVAPEPVSA